MQPINNPWRIVATREIATKLRDKTFIFSTIFTLILIAVSIALPALLNRGADNSTIAVLNDKAATYVEVANNHNERAELTSHHYDTREAAETALAEDEADALLIPAENGWELIFNSASKPTLEAQLTQAITSSVTAENATAAGIDLTALSQGTAVETIILNGENNTMIVMLVGMVFAMLFYMASFIFGQVIAMSVVEEKQNRIVEIIATAIPISQLLAGKVIGNIILATGQILLYGIVGLTAANAMGMLDEFGWMLSVAGWFIAFYIIGFAAIATIWAAVGAMASRSEDIQSLSTPITIILVGALFAGIYSTGTVLTILSYIPVISSITMPMRLMSQDVATWEPIIALILGILATFVFTKIGAKIYANNIMRSGSAVTWKQALSQKASA